MVSLFYVVHMRLFPSYTKIGGLRIGKVRVGRNKWYLYFMLFTYGLFRLTRKSIYIYMNELYSLDKSSRQKTITLQCIYLF